MLASGGSLLSSPAAPFLSLRKPEHKVSRGGVTPPAPTGSPAQPASGRQRSGAQSPSPLPPGAPCMRRMPGGMRPTTGRAGARRWCSSPPGW